MDYSDLVENIVNDLLEVDSLEQKRENSVNAKAYWTDRRARDAKRVAFRKGIKAKAPEPEEDTIAEGTQFWSDVQKQLAASMSLDPNTLAVQNSGAKGWDILHYKNGMKKFPLTIGTGQTLQHAFSDALGRIPKDKPKKDTQGDLF